MKLIQKPNDGEFPPYAIMYIKLLPDDGLLLHHFAENFRATKDLISRLPEEKLLVRFGRIQFLFSVSQGLSGKAL